MCVCVCAMPYLLLLLRRPLREEVRSDFLRIVRTVVITSAIIWSLLMDQDCAVRDGEGGPSGSSFPRW